MDLGKIEKIIEDISESNSFPNISLSTKRISPKRLEILWDGYHCEFEYNVGNSFMEFSKNDKVFIVPIYLSMDWLNIGSILELVHNTKNFDELFQKKLSDRINKNYFWAENECKKLLWSLDVDFTFQEFVENPNDHGLTIDIGDTNSYLSYDDYWDCDNYAEGKKIIDVITSYSSRDAEQIELDFNNPDVALEDLRSHIAKIRKRELTEQMTNSVLDFWKERRSINSDLKYLHLFENNFCITIGDNEYKFSIGNYNGSDKDTFWLSVSQTGTAKVMCFELYNQMFTFGMENVDMFIKSLLLGFAVLSFDEMFKETSRFHKTLGWAVALCRNVLKENNISNNVYSDKSILFSVNGICCELYTKNWDYQVWNDKQEKKIYIEYNKQTKVIELNDTFENGVSEFRRFIKTLSEDI